MKHHRCGEHHIISSTYSQSTRCHCATLQQISAAGCHSGRTQPGCLQKSPELYDLKEGKWTTKRHKVSRYPLYQQNCDMKVMPMDSHFLSFCKCSNTGHKIIMYDNLRFRKALMLAGDKEAQSSYQVCSQQDSAWVQALIASMSSASPCLTSSEFRLH